MGATPMEAATIDCLYESVRDIKSAWFRAKQTADVPGTPPGAARREAMQRWWTEGLPERCRALEAAVCAAAPSGAAAGPWLVGAHVSLADVACYHLLSAASSVVCGACVSFFDGEHERVSVAYAGCPRLAAAVAAVGALPSVRHWEEVRPDTFS